MEQWARVHEICDSIRAALIDLDGASPQLRRLHGLACAPLSPRMPSALISIQAAAAKAVETTKPEVPRQHLLLYAHAFILGALLKLQAGEPVELAIKDLDAALIVAGSAVDPELRSRLDELLDALPPAVEPEIKYDYFCDPAERLAVDCRYRPALRFPARSMEGTSMRAFEALLRTSRDPVHIVGYASAWPACALWNSPKYWMSVTNGGSRVVPVEVGRSYVSAEWAEEFRRFGDVLVEWLEPGRNGGPTAYLAQHDLLLQVAGLRKDILQPDLIYCDMFSASRVVRNAWIGPRDTISPLHCDVDDNILVQVVGYKYVRMYAPGTRVYPRAAADKLANTSAVELERGVYGSLFGDCDVDFAGMRARMQAKQEYRQRYADFAWHDGFVECILSPGDALHIPVSF